MKSKIVSTVAAALLVGAAGLTTAIAPTVAVAEFNFSNFCVKVFGGQISKPSFSSFSGWKTSLCVRHTVWTNHSQRRVRAVGAARFKKYLGKATFFNQLMCQNSRVTVWLFRKNGSTWQLVQKKTVKAKAKIAFGRIWKCSADAGTRYAKGSLQYRTVIMAVNGENHVSGNIVGSLIRSHHWL